MSVLSERRPTGRRRRLLFGALALSVMLLSVGSFYTACRRIGVPLGLLRGAVVVQGNITEKLAHLEPDGLLPLSITIYRVRYAFPTPQGQMRTGEQVVTRRTYHQLGDQGAPVNVTLLRDNPGVNAVDARIAFPGIGGLRLGLGIVCLLIAYGILLFGVMPG